MTVSESGADAEPEHAADAGAGGSLDGPAIAALARDFAARRGARAGRPARWREPLTAFADARDPGFGRLRALVRPDHLLPDDILPGAATVIVYFLPLSEETVRSNEAGAAASREWAVAYVETNAALAGLARFLKDKLEAAGHGAAAVPDATQFDAESLSSRWSLRHAAVIAGLGTLGLNRMLLTEAGCCGRLGGVLTTLKLPPTPRPGRELCPHRPGSPGSCAACVSRCAAGALTRDSFDAKRCYAVCLENARLHAGAGLAEVCGKCLCGVPCSLAAPGAATGS